MQTIVLLSLACWIGVIPCLVVALRLRRARLADVIAASAPALPRACEGRRRLGASALSRGRAHHPL